MKTRAILLLLALPLCIASCFRDKTTLGDGEISEILIAPDCLKNHYDIDKNEVLTLEPIVSQTYRDKELSFRWEVDQKLYSTERVLHYTGDRLGSFQCRLVVENEDGKAFHAFTVNVNSPYEEGMTVLSVDENGQSMISFMLTQYDQSKEAYFEKGDCFTLNNPDEAFAPWASDMVQCNQNLIVCCKGGNGESGTLYYLHDKTFVMENKLTAPEYPDFKPVALAIPGTGSVGSAYPIVCENGKVYEFSVAEGALVQADNFRSTYALKPAIYTDRSPGYFSIFLWDSEVGGLSLFYNAYGPFYCGSDYLLERDNCVGEKNYFNGLEFVTMFMPRVPQGTTEQPTLVVVTKKGNLYQKVILDGIFFWDRNDEGRYIVLDHGGKIMAGFKDPGINSQTPIVASRLYYAMFYGVGNQVKRWNYNTSQLFDQAGVHLTVGSGTAVVTGMELSLDQTELFVAFYEPEETGLNGHVWVFNTDSGEKLRQYDNIGYRPVKIMYKKK